MNTTTTSQPARRGTAWSAGEPKDRQEGLEGRGQGGGPPVAHGQRRKIDEEASDLNLAPDAIATMPLGLQMRQDPRGGVLQAPWLCKLGPAAAIGGAGGASAHGQDDSLPPDRRLRSNLSDFFLSNDVSSSRAQSLFDDGELAGARHVADLATVGQRGSLSKNLARDSRHSNPVVNVDMYMCVDLRYIVCIYMCSLAFRLLGASLIAPP